MSSTPDISVVIRTYTEDRWVTLVGAVRSALNQSLPPREVLVVVDHNPALLARVRAELPEAAAVESRGPRGSAGAWNSGVAAARGEVVAFLDDDAAAAPDWLASLAAAYVSPEVVGAGGAIVPVWLGGRPAWFPREFDWVVGCTYAGMPEEDAPVRNLIGCNMSFRREVFEELGGFRHGLGHVGGRPLGCDETELCIRVRQRWPWAVLRHAPAAQVFHQVPAARGTVRYFLARCAMEGRSKALVAALVGAGDGTSAERAHALRTLPAAVRRGVADALRRGDRHGLARAAAICAGLAVTAGSYLRGRAAQRAGLWRVEAPAPRVPGGLRGEVSP